MTINRKVQSDLEIKCHFDAAGAEHWLVIATAINPRTFEQYEYVVTDFSCHSRAADYVEEQCGLTTSAVWK